MLDMKSARRKLGLSLSEFAALHGCSTDAPRRWEKPKGSTGYREPSGSAKQLTRVLLVAKERYACADEDDFADGYNCAMDDIMDALRTPEQGE